MKPDSNEFDETITALLEKLESDVSCGLKPDFDGLYRILHRPDQGRSFSGNDFDTFLLNCFRLIKQKWTTYGRWGGGKYTDDDNDNLNPHLRRAMQLAEDLKPLFLQIQEQKLVIQDLLSEIAMHELVARSDLAVLEGDTINAALLSPTSDALIFTTFQERSDPRSTRIVKLFVKGRAMRQALAELENGKLRSKHAITAWCHIAAELQSLKEAWQNEPDTQKAPLEITQKRGFFD